MKNLVPFAALVLLLLAAIPPLPAESHASGGRAAGSFTPLTTGSGASLYGVSWKPFSDFAVTVGSEGTVLYYNGSAFSSKGSGSDTYRAAAWNPAGGYALVAGETGPPIPQGVLRKFDGGTLALTPVTAPGARPLRGVAWSPNGSQALIVGVEGSAYSSTGGAAATPLAWADSGEDYLSAAWAPDGAYALVGGTGPNATGEPKGLLLRWYPGNGTVERFLNESIIKYSSVSSRPGGGLWLLTGFDDVSQRPVLHIFDGSAFGVVPPATPSDWDNLEFSVASWSNTTQPYALIAGTDIMYDPVERAGVVWRYDGTLSRISYGAYEGLSGLAWRADREEAMLVGANGTALLYTGNRPPSVLITTPFEGAAVWGNFTVSGSASDPDGDAISRVNLRVDSGNWLNATGTSSWTATLSTQSLSVGEHTVSVTASDGTAVSAPAARKIVVDTPPVVAITAPVANATLSGTAYINGTATDPDGDTISAVYVRIDGEPYATASGTSSWSLAWNTSAYAAGAHSIYARASDGRLNSSDVSVAVRVENAGANLRPVVNFSAPGDGSVVSGTVTVNGTASDPDGDAIAKVEVRADGGAWSPASGREDWTYHWNAGAAGRGEHTLSARATDGRGAFSAEASRRFVVDGVPSVTVDYPPSGTILTGTAEVRGTAYDPDSDALTVEVRTDSGAWAAAGMTGTAWLYSLDTTPLSEGKHTLWVRAYDGLLHSAEVSRAISVNRPPKAVVLQPPSEVTPNTLLVAWSRSADADFLRYEVHISTNPPFTPDTSSLSKVISSPTTLSANLTGLAPATSYTVLVRVVDSGDLSADSNRVTASTAKLNRNPAAVLTFSKKTSGAAVMVAFDASASSDPDGKIVKYEWDLNTDGVYDSETAVPTFAQKYTRDGSHTVRVRVTDDSGGTATADVTFTVRVKKEGGGVPGFEALLLLLGAGALARAGRSRLPKSL